MGSDATDPRIDEGDESVDEEVDGSCTSRNKHRKVPKRVLKAEREKLKRELLNELFSKLAGVLELNEQNNGKACILHGTIKLLTTEKKELKDENSALEAQIKEIQKEMDERISQSNPNLNSIPPGPGGWEPGMGSNFSEVSSSPPFQASADPTFQPPPFLGPVYVIASSGPDLQAYSKPGTVINPPSNVSKPHARYATPADPWTLQLLEK